MKFFSGLRKRWREQDYYGSFEQVILRVLLLFLALVTVYMVVLVAIRLFEDFQLGAAFMEKAALQDAFGSILSVLILLEFNHSIAVAIKEKTGAIQVRIIVFITILVVARKIMVLDFASATLESLLGFAALLLALGALLWLISSADRGRPPAGSAGP